MFDKIYKRLSFLYKCLFIPFVLYEFYEIATNHKQAATRFAIVGVVVLTLIGLLLLILKFKTTLGRTMKVPVWTIVGFVLTASLGILYLLKRSPPGNAPKAPSDFISLPLTGSAGLEQDPSASPDGSELAYVWDGENKTESIYVKRIGSGLPLRVTSDTDGDVQSPAWFEDGKLIAYVRPVGDKEELWEIPTLKGPKRKLGEIYLDPRKSNRHPGLTVSPDGLSLAVPRGGVPNELPGIFMLSRMTGEWRRLTSGDFADCLPSFSPDGGKIAFVHENALGLDDIYVVPVANGEPKRLTSDKDRAAITGVTWTPDGSEIVYASNLGGNFALWRIKASGGTPEKTGITFEFLANPSISRRGRLLAYARESSNINIWSLEIPLKPHAPLSPVKFISSASEENSPQYSPNGNKVAFVSTRSGFYEIYVCDADGSNLIALTNYHRPIITGSPRWSPDGKSIVFDSRLSDKSQIYTKRVDDTLPPRLVNSGLPGDDAVPSWSVDGNWIFFSSTSVGRSEIWKVPVAGGEAIRLTHEGGFAPLPSPDGRFVYYAKGVSKTGIWRVSVDGGKEMPVMDDLQAGFWGQWGVIKSGIYFMSVGAKKQASIRFFRFSTQKVEHVFSPDKPPEAATDGLAISSDGRSILYTQVDMRKANIMLIEDFH
jgi:Tol biopolymer transport system component